MIPRLATARALRLASQVTSSAATRSYTIHSALSRTQPKQSLSRLHQPRSASHVPHQTVRWLSNKSVADEKIEEITELYATAQDEFEIAMEETEKVSVYAEEDRKAAREEMEKVQEAFQKIVDGPDQTLAEEVKNRVGQRIRELEQGVQRMEEIAQEQD